MKINLNIDSKMLIEILETQITGVNTLKPHEILKVIPNKDIKNLYGELCITDFSIFACSAPKGKMINKFIMLSMQYGAIGLTDFISWNTNLKSKISEQQFKIIDIYYSAKYRSKKG